MKSAATFLFLFALVCVPFSYMFVDVPDGMDNPHLARTILTVIKLGAVIGDSIEPVLGPDYHVKAIRLITHIASNMLPRPAAPPNVQIRNSTFGGVPVLVYTPDDLAPGGPGVVWIHGGGWVFGTTKQDRTPLYLAAKLKAVIVSVEYRLAPEHPFPVPLEDCEAAVVHFMKNAPEYDVDPEKIVIAGDSAGGNLAAAVSLSLRNKDFRPRPSAQVLIYPALQPLDFRTPSYHQNPDHPIIRTHLMASAWLWYAVGHAGDKHILLSNEHAPVDLQMAAREEIMRLDKLPDDFIPPDFSRESKDQSLNDENYSHKYRQKWAEWEKIFTNPLFSPMMAEDVSGLPASLVITVEDDVLRDEGVWYAQRLAEAGVPTVHKHYKHGFHGMLFFEAFKETHDIVDDITAYIRSHVKEIQ